MHYTICYLQVIGRVQRVKVFMGFVILGLLVMFLIHHWSPNAPTGMDDQRRLNSTITKLLGRNEQLKKGETTVPYQLKEITAR